MNNSKHIEQKKGTAQQHIHKSCHRKKRTSWFELKTNMATKCNVSCSVFFLFNKSIQLIYHKSVLSASVFALLMETGGGGGGNVGLLIPLGDGGVFATLPSFNSIKLPSDLVRT